MGEKTIVEHNYNLPKTTEIPKENYRSVSIIRMNESIHLSTNDEHENMDYLANKALTILSKIKENNK